MQIDVRAKGLELTEPLRVHAERRVRFALGSTGARVRSVALRLADESGAREGKDKCCILRATVLGAPPLVIEQHDTDFRIAIDRAADRARRALSRRFDPTRANGVESARR